MRFITLSLLFLAFLFISHTTFAQEGGKSSIISEIREIYTTDSPKKIREIFDYYYSIYDEDEMLKSIIGKNSSILKNKFMLWKITDNGFGGYFLGIATSPKPKTIILWRVSIYRIDRQNDKYEIRQFEKIPFLNKTEKREFLELFEKKYQNYWM